MAAKITPSQALSSQATTDLLRVANSSGMLYFMLPPFTTFFSLLTHDSRLDEFPCYSPVDTWAGDASRGNNPMTDLFFDFGPNGGHPAPNA